MRITSATLAAALGCLMITLAGCSSGWQLQAQPRLAVDDERSGRPFRFLTASRLLQLAQRGLTLAKDPRPKDLYISDVRTVVLLKNGTYKDAGTIAGLVSPDGDFVDAAGNFYAADYDAVDIQEYKPGGKSPSFTYKRGMIDPVTVSVDSHGNVYEADYDGRYVNEYAQKSNTVMNSCSPGGGVEGASPSMRATTCSSTTTRTHPARARSPNTRAAWADAKRRSLTWRSNSRVGWSSTHETNSS